MRIVNAEDLCGIEPLLSLISEGESVVIVRGDRPIAVLSPYVPRPDEEGDPEAPDHDLRRRLHHAHQERHHRPNEDDDSD